MISNCSNVENTIVTTTGDVGGIIGVSNSDNTQIENCTINNVEISGEGYSMGGIAGYVENLSGLNNNVVRGLTIDSTTERNNYKNGSLAAMVADTNGVNEANSYIYTNNNISDSTLTSGSNNIGGIIGVTNDNVEFANCNIDNVHFTYTNTIEAISVPKEGGPYYRNMGGLVACNTGIIEVGKPSETAKIKAENCSLTGSELKSKSGPNIMYNLGGLVRIYK